MFWVYFDPFTSTFHEGSLLVTIILVIISTYPVIYWLWAGWAWKENDILVSLTTDAKDEYLFVFQKQDKNFATADLRFTKFYNKWYGRSTYVVPLACFVLVLLYLSISLSETALYYLIIEQGGPKPDSYARLPVIAASAYAGAYLFAGGDLISRSARRDITADDVLNNALRLAGSVPLGYAFSQLLSPSFGPFIAFAIGAFPLSILATVLRRIANKQLKLDIGADTAPDQVVKLSGVDANTSDRIAECDITTISQLAYCDPIQLAMRSNLNFSFIIDIVSQALAWVYFGEDLQKVRSMGVRGALEVLNIVTDLASTDEPKQQTASQLLQVLAKSINLDGAGFLNALREIAGDPRTTFLTKVCS